MHLCYFDDAEGDYVVERGEKEGCQLCAKKQKRKLRIDLSSCIIKNAEQRQRQLKPVDISTRDMSLSVEQPSPEYLARLRRQAGGCFKLTGQKKQKNVSFFQNDEAQDHPLLQTRMRPNYPRVMDAVTDIEYYSMDGAYINENLMASQSHKRRKVLNREYMLVEKFFGFYHAEGDMFGQDGFCVFCGEKIEVKSYEEIQKAQPLCDFCHDRLKAITDSEVSIKSRQRERKENRKYREQFIHQPKMKRQKQDRNRVPRILISESEDSDEEKKEYRVIQKKLFDFNSFARKDEDENEEDENDDDADEEEDDFVPDEDSI